MLVDGEDRRCGLKLLLVGLDGENCVVVAETADIDSCDRDIARNLSLSDRAIDPEHSGWQEEQGDREEREEGEAGFHDTFRCGFMGFG